jgi:hypothetical protein
MIRTVLIATLAVVMVSALNAQPAAADDPGAVTRHQQWADAELRDCVTPYRVGVLGEHGAPGYFIDGCTVTLWCPPERRCNVRGDGFIQTQRYAGHWVTLNSRLRTFRSDGSLIGWQDRSCGRTVDICSAPTMTAVLESGQAASEQCNGVRENAPNTASVLCQVYLEYI